MAPPHGGSVKVFSGQLFDPRCKKYTAIPFCLLAPLGTNFWQAGLGRSSRQAGKQAPAQLRMEAMTKITEASAQIGKLGPTHAMTRRI